MTTMRADLPERLETLARECSDALMFDGRKALTEAALALRALRDAPVGEVVELDASFGALRACVECSDPRALADTLFRRVRLVADGDTATGGGHG